MQPASDMSGVALPGISRDGTNTCSTEIPARATSPQDTMHMYPSGENVKLNDDISTRNKSFCVKQLRCDDELSLASKSSGGCTYLRICQWNINGLTQDKLEDEITGNF